MREEVVLSRLEVAERELEFMVRLSKGRFKSKYERTGKLRTDLAACHREMEEAFDFLGTIPDDEKIPLQCL